jgi:sarcosine oxidase subunit gamma
MSEDFLRQGPLDHLGLESRAVAEAAAEHGVSLRERSHRGIVNLRGLPEDAAFMAAAEKALGFALPTAANTVAGDGATGDSGKRAIWLGPNEWWIVDQGDGPAIAAELSAALDDVFAAVTDVSENYTVIEIAGARARDTLAKGTPFDLHPRVFQPGQSAQTMLAKATACLHQTSEAPAYDVYVRCSFAEYLWRWLEDAAGEYGVSVLAG